jgi:hypothetical protein
MGECYETSASRHRFEHKLLYILNLPLICDDAICVHLLTTIVACSDKLIDLDSLLFVYKMCPFPLTMLG